MSCDEVFVEYLLELLAPMGEVSSKRMFGGYGFFMDGLMFGLVAESTFYLKTDDENQSLFENKGLEPFVYEKTNKNVIMSYYQAPEEAIESSEAMTLWAQSAFEAAKRAKARKAVPTKHDTQAAVASNIAEPLDDEPLDNMDYDGAESDGFDDDTADIPVSISRE